MSRVAVGGTFDPVHDGHRKLLARARQLSLGGELVVGLTSNQLARQRIRDVEDFKIRKRRLADFMRRELDARPRIVKLDDPYGPTLDEDFDYLVVSPETEPTALSINRKRIQLGKSPIEVVRVEYALAYDGQPISSTRIYNGEIDIHGNPVQHR